MKLGNDRRRRKTRNFEAAEIVEFYLSYKRGIPTRHPLYGVFAIFVTNMKNFIFLCNFNIDRRVVFVTTMKGTSTARWCQ